MTPDSQYATIIVTGGGTSGHVLPAVAIADALVGRGRPRASIHYVGTVRGVEQRLLPSTGYSFTLLDVVGLQRSLSLRNLAFVPKLVSAVWGARRLMRSLHPAVVVNVGGYASFPATYAAQRMGIPTVMVSYDRRPGLVTRVLARRATACAVAFEGSTLPRAVVTGAPVRPDLVGIDRAGSRVAARQRLGLPADRFVVAVVGGSLGAGVINTSVSEMVEHCGERDDLAVWHVVGERFVSSAAPERSGEAGILYRVIGYEEQMMDLYCAADLFVTRAGAGTIAELATVGVPAIVVPWPGAAENHQLDNARVLSDVGAAVLIEQAHLNAGRLLAEIDRFVADPHALTELAIKARRAGARHRDGSLIDLVESAATR